MLLYLAPFYAVLYWILGWRNPRIPLMLIFATAPLQNDMSGGGPLRFSIAEINMLLTVPLLFLCKRRPLTLGPLTGGIAFYLLVSLGCTLLHWRPTSLICLVQMALYLGVAVLIFYALPRNEYDYQLAMDGLILMSVALAATVLIKRTGFVWNLHKNGVGESLAASLIVCAEMWFAAYGKRKRVLSAAFVIIAAGLFFTLSRGAWLGALVGIGALIALRGQFRLLFRLSVVLIPLLALCWSHLPATSREYATGFSSADNYNIKLRYDSVSYAESLFHDSPWTGNGVGLRKEYDATNIIWCTLAETGVVGLFAFLVFHWVILQFTWKTQRNIHRSTPLYSGIALGGALVLSRLLHGMVDHYWGRGSNTVVWSAVGMALYGYYAKRRSMLLARREALLAAMEAEREPVTEIAPPVLAY